MCNTLALVMYQEFNVQCKMTLRAVSYCGFLGVLLSEVHFILLFMSSFCTENFIGKTSCSATFRAMFSTTETITTWMKKKKE